MKNDVNELRSVVSLDILIEIHKPLLAVLYRIVKFLTLKDREYSITKIIVVLEETHINYISFIALLNSISNCLIQFCEKFLFVNHNRVCFIGFYYIIRSFLENVSVNLQFRR